MILLKRILIIKLKVCPAVFLGIFVSTKYIILQTRATDSRRAVSQNQEIKKMDKAVVFIKSNGVGAQPAFTCSR